MNLFITDISRHQVERPDALDLAKAKAAGMNAVNIQLDRGRQEDVLPGWALEYAEGARSLSMPVSTYRWLDARISGAESAIRAFARMRTLGGPQGMAHVVDCEDNAPLPVLRDYVAAMTDMLQRPIAIYSGRWWWTATGRNWNGSNLSAYLWAAPNAGYLTDYPGDDSPHWTAGYGGWPVLSAMQYTVKRLPDTGNCSLSAIRDPNVWAALTGEAVPMAWFLNRALTNFRAAVNAKYTKRDKASDGTIGDRAHAASVSDHNPDPDGSVDAWDMDVELNGVGQPYAADVEALKRVFQAHPSSRYWIHNRQIARRSTGWKREVYTGDNAHDKHVHWNTDQANETSTAPWVLTESGGTVKLDNQDVAVLLTGKDDRGYYNEQPNTPAWVDRAMQFTNEALSKKLDELATAVAGKDTAVVEVDAAQVAAALAADASFLAAVAKAVNDDAARRGAE